MKDKKSFILYADLIDTVRVMSDEDAGALFKMILNYENEIEITERVDTRSDQALIAFTFIQRQLDAFDKAYQEKKQARSEAGKKGMSKRWGDNKPITNDNKPITKDNKAITNDSKGITKITDTVTDTVTVTDTDIDTKEKSKRETAEAVVNLYHECCPSLPKVSKLNPMRIKLANARLKDYTMDELKAIFIKAENSTFLKEGQGTWNGANFDWILNQTNICKIEDGYYSNGEEKKEEEETRPVVGYILNDEYMMAPCYDQEEYERFMRERYGE